MAVNFLLDSGAACSVIRRQDLLDVYLLENKIFNQHHNVVTANGSQLNVNFQLELELDIGGYLKKHTFHIVDNISQNILGWDIMQKFNIVLANGKCFVDPLAATKLDNALNTDCIAAKRKYTIHQVNPNGF